MSERDPVWDHHASEHLSETIGQCWPGVEADARARLVEGLTMSAERTHTTLKEVISAVVACADAGRSSLPSVGTVQTVVRDRRAQVAGRAPRPVALLPDGGKPASPWMPSLWLAAFLVENPSLIEGDDDADKLGRLRPWLEMVRELGLKPEHGVSTHPAYREEKVNEANRRADELYSRVGGVSEHAAIRTMTGGWK